MAFGRFLIKFNANNIVFLGRNTGFPIKDDIEFKVWNDMKNKNVKGVVMIPYSHHTHKYLEEFIHDLVRFNINIKHVKNIDIV